ncbi:ileal sodium/bile acid cotransporter-like [Strongylocentrotus purpuratus]|uniref:Ileal sodium/bile acid cotransporter n=1 Tax=Strongylocentrotus purpuratus TaxID=7668 RepID=A0A7M7P703_STRPU|nr:ileal sodium/bile acid cotransporter-like [Strongylocentrotus purpuratus]
MEDSTMMPTTIMNWTMNTTGNETLIEPYTGPDLKLATKVINMILLMLLMISMGCTLNYKDFRKTIRRPTGFFIGMLCQFVLMPLIGFCIALAFQLPSAGALSLLILACCPGGTLSNLYTYWVDGDVCLSVCMTAASTAVAIGMMPLNLFIYSRVWTDDKAIIPYVNIVTTLVIILVPVAFGVFLNWWKKSLTKHITRIGIVCSFICLIFAIAISIIMNPAFFKAGWRLWFCAAILPMIGFCMGYSIARLLRQPHKKCRSIAFETGSQNVSLALTITVVTFADSPLFLDMLFYPSLYLCFINIDSFTVIFLYKIVTYYREKNCPRKEKEPNDKDVDDEDDDDSNNKESDEKESTKNQEMKPMYKKIFNKNGEI